MSWSSPDEKPSTLNTILGSVVGLIRKRGRPAKIKAPSTEAPAPEPTIATSATDTATTELRNSSGSITFAESITSPSSNPTVWNQSLMQFVEGESKPITESDLAYLESTLRQRLLSLAEDRGEPVEQTVREIIEFLADDENNVWQEGTIEDALAFYFENELIHA